ncbi:MAG TPA: prepilin-type N-terminal cleavage/methylation domain-containing protein [Pyrinomonadaceae bacterium]|jgi:Tfp pilus assembly protein PilV
MSSESKSRCKGSTAQNRPNERGFSIIEASIALVILMIAGLGVVSVFTYSIQYNSGGNDRAVAISIAQQQMEQFRSVSFTDPVLAVSGPTVLSPNTVSNGRSYRVTKTITGSNNNVSGNPTLKTITIRVDPISSGWAGFPVILRTMRSTTTTGTH